MSALLLSLLLVLLLPLFLATWRASLAGLAAQGFLMAWISYRLHPSLGPSQWLTLVDLLVLRGLVVPLMLRRVMIARGAPARNDVIPPNILFWSASLGLVIVAFRGAEALVPTSGVQQSLVAVAATGVLLGFLVLSTQSGPFSQVVGALRLENAIALLALGGEPLEAPGIQLGELAVLAVTVVLYGGYLRALDIEGAARVEEPAR